jgi:SAM-dependent methyltransferase
VRGRAGGGRTAVDSYWTGHMVRAPDFLTARGSGRYLEWRFAEYPLFRELSGLWGDHSGEVVLDYGCGPGNDLLGLALYSEARQIVGVDVSRTALDRAAERLALHSVEPGRVDLLEVSDAEPHIPLEDGSVDYAVSLGVVHHTSDPASILRELARVLRPGGSGCLMVYNRDSIYYHLYTAYERMVVEGAFTGLDTDAAFARNTDGEDCPISRNYGPEEFTTLCAEADLEADFVGGYLSRRELQSLDESFAEAIADERLAGEHRAFLRGLTFDPAGYPQHAGYHAGIGGTYRFRRA